MSVALRVYVRVVLTRVEAISFLGLPVLDGGLSKNRARLGSSTAGEAQKGHHEDEPLHGGC